MRLAKKHFGPPGQTVFYAGWATLSIPRVPTDPISEADALERDTFYQAVYDDEGRLKRFTKFLHGKPDWADEYQYWDNGKLRQRVMTRADGSTRTEEYDRRGRLDH